MRVHTKRWEMSEALWPWRWHDDLCARECRGCSRGRRGQRCYCLTHQHGVKAKSRLMAPCVYMCVQLAYELHWYLFNNWSHSHTHTHRPSLFSGLLWRLLLFYGLTCHDGGMTATLKVRQEREWRTEGRKDVVFRNGLLGSECQLKRREEMKDREWNRSRGKREREREEANMPDVLLLPRWSPVQLVQSGRLFMLNYAFSLSSAFQSLCSIFTYCEWNIQSRVSRYKTWELVVHHG